MRELAVLLLCGLSKFEEVESNVGGPVQYQARLDGKQWGAIKEGDWLKGQSVELRARVDGVDNE